MHTTREIITEIALQARADFELRTIAHPLLADLYIDYNPEIENIDEFLDQAAELFPASNCGLTAVYLRHVLHQAKIIPARPRLPGEQFGTYDEKNHTFTLLRLGPLVVDITADQFGGPPVYVGPLQDPWKINQ